MYLKNLICITFLSFTALTIHAQDKLYSKTGKIHFIAKDHPSVEATSQSAVAMLYTKSGDLNFSILVKSFELVKAGMVEKFQNKILETEKFPKAEFKGKIVNPSAVNYKKDGEYPVQVSGNFTLHGVTKEVLVDGVITVKNAVVTSKSVFVISIDDYQVSNPGVGDGKITITVDADLETLKN